MTEHEGKNTHWSGKSSPLKYTVNRKNIEGILVRNLPNSRMNQAIVNDKYSILLQRNSLMFVGTDLVLKCMLELYHPIMKIWR